MEHFRTTIQKVGKPVELITISAFHELCYLSRIHREVYDPESRGQSFYRAIAHTTKRIDCLRLRLSQRLDP